MIFQVMLLMHRDGERASMGLLTRDFKYVLVLNLWHIGTCNTLMNHSVKF